MTRRAGLLPAALQRIRASVLFPLLGGNLLLLLAAAIALNVPDSHTWQLLLSLLLGCGFLSGLLLWNASAIRRMRKPEGAAPLWLGALLLGAWLLLAALLFHWVGFAEPNIETRAGYWNSQMSSGMRHLLPYTRLVTLQHFAMDAFRWVVLPALLLPPAMETATFGLKGGALGRSVRALCTAWHWITAAVALGFAAWLVPVLVTWHPAHTVSGETVSAVLRLGLAALLATSAVLWLLATDAELLSRRQAARELSSEAAM